MEYLALVPLTSFWANTAELQDLVLEQAFLFLNHSGNSSQMSKINFLCQMRVT